MVGRTHTQAKLREILARGDSSAKVEQMRRNGSVQDGQPWGATISEVGPTGNGRRTSRRRRSLEGGVMALNKPTRAFLNEHLRANESKCYWEIIDALGGFQNVATDVRLSLLLNKLQHVFTKEDEDLAQVYMKNRANERQWGIKSKRGSLTGKFRTSTSFKRRSSRALLAKSSIFSPGSFETPKRQLAILVRKIKVEWARSGLAESHFLSAAGQETSFRFRSPGRSRGSKTGAMLNQEMERAKAEDGESGTPRNEEKKEADEKNDDADPSSMVPLADFKKQLASLQVQLSDSESKLLVEAFGDSHDQINLQKLTDLFPLSLEDMQPQINERGIELFGSLFTQETSLKINILTMTRADLDGEDMWRHTGQDQDGAAAAGCCGRSNANANRDGSKFGGDKRLVWLFRIFMNSPRDFKLCERALEYLDRCYQTKLEFLESIDDGLVLFDETRAVDLKQEVRTRFELLRHNICKIHLWALGGDGTGMACVRRVLNDTGAIIRALSKTISDAKLKDECQHERAQLFMVKLGVPDYILNILKIAAVYVAPPPDAKTTVEDEKLYLTDLRRDASKILALMLENNPAVQHSFQVYLLDFIEVDLASSSSTTTASLGVLDVVLLLLRNDPELTQRIREKTIMEYASVIDRVGWTDPRHTKDIFQYLELMETLTNARGVPSPEMQTLVLNVLTSPNLDRVCTTYHAVSYTGHMQQEGGYLQRRALTEACLQVHTKQYENELDYQQHHHHLLYHARIVEMLAQCCHGKHESNQGKCAKMLPVSVVIRVIAESVAALLDAFPEADEPDPSTARQSDDRGPRESDMGSGAQEAKGDGLGDRLPEPLDGDGFAANHPGRSPQASKPVHVGGGVQMPKWGDTLVLHAFTVFLRHVYLENDYDDSSNSRGAQDTGVDAVLDELWALENIMQSFASLINKFVELVALHGPCGNDDFDPTYQGPPLGSVHNPTSPASICETTLRLIYEGIVPALYCFYSNPKLGGRSKSGEDRSWSRLSVSRSLNGEVSNENETGDRRLSLELSQVAFEAREAVAVALDGLVWSTNVTVDLVIATNISDLVRDLCAVVGPSCQRTYEVVWLTTAKRCLDMISDQTDNSAVHTEQGEGLLDELVYAERPSSISTLISERHRRFMDAELLETLDSNAVSEMHSGGVVIDGAGTGLAEDALRQELGRFGVISSVRRRSATRVSVYYKGDGALKSNPMLFERAYQLEQSVLNGSMRDLNGNGSGGSDGSGSGGSSGGSGSGEDDGGDGPDGVDVVHAQVLLFQTSVLDQEFELVKSDTAAIIKSRIAAKHHIDAVDQVSRDK